MFLLFSSGNANVALFEFIWANAEPVLLLKPVDDFPSLPYWYTDSFSRTTLVEPRRLGLRLSFPEPYEAFNLKISFSTAKTLQNSEICNEIDTTALKCQVKIYTSPFGLLTAAMEEDTNQTSGQSRKWRIFHIWKMCLAAQSTLDDTGSLITSEKCVFTHMFIFGYQQTLLRSAFSPQS